MTQLTLDYNQSQTIKSYLQDIFQVIYINLTKETGRFIAFGCYKFKMWQSIQE